ncbi:MAG: hypothetical protein KDH08_23750, partial [Anaerolineae bacterium]|nr:hypothetical protein [Anaerolineae bacterium]
AVAVGVSDGAAVAVAVADGSTAANSGAGVLVGVGVGIGCWLPQPLRANANSTRQLANGKRSAGDDVSGWKTAAANADAPLNDLATGGVAGELGMDCTAPIMP